MGWVWFWFSDAWMHFAGAVVFSLGFSWAWSRWDRLQVLPLWAILVVAFLPIAVHAGVFAVALVRRGLHRRTLVEWELRCAPRKSNGVGNRQPPVAAKNPLDLVYCCLDLFGPRCGLGSFRRLLRLACQKFP